MSVQGVNASVADPASQGFQGRRRDRDARTITLTQTVYIEKMFSKFLSASNTKAWTTPIDMSRDGTAKFHAIKCAESEREANEMEGKDFNGLLGTLLYACCMTRPDVAFYTAFLCQFMQAPTVEHAALRILQRPHPSPHLRWISRDDA